MVVAQVRTHDDARLRPAPQCIQHTRHFRFRGLSHQERHQLEVVQDDLQKRQMHLEAMFRRMGPSAICTPAKPVARAIPARSRGTAPSGVANASIPLAATPAKPLKCEGPTSTTR